RLPQVQRLRLLAVALVRHRDIGGGIGSGQSRRRGLAGLAAFGFLLPFLQLFPLPLFLGAVARGALLAVIRLECHRCLLLKSRKKTKGAPVARCPQVCSTPRRSAA